MSYNESDRARAHAVTVPQKRSNENHVLEEEDYTDVQTKRVRGARDDNNQEHSKRRGVKYFAKPFEVNIYRLDAVLKVSVASERLSLKPELDESQENVRKYSSGNNIIGRGLALGTGNARHS